MVMQYDAPVSGQDTAQVPAATPRAPRRWVLLLIGLILWQAAGPLAGATWWVFDEGPLMQRPRDVLTETSPVGAVRVFGDYPGQDADGAARETVDALVADGGFSKDTVMIALPTGSGWVDPEQVEAVEDWADGDVATVSVRYAHTPSAVAYLMRPDLAEASATALLQEVLDRVSGLPQDQRPEVIVQGQSLGVGAGTAAVKNVTDAGTRTPVAAQLWQGRPGTVDAPEQDRCTVDQINDDDPVAKLNLRLAVNPLAAVGVLADLPGSASSTPGTRHSYQPVLPPDGCLASRFSALH
ncbi:Hypothetical protein CGLY_02275 [Corynebacterium glyciniphilum AJ 3170]|uniref:Alpha/beta-hydrolase catalytic domain-containing protein n=2 Tax=Corynebacterium TaxID=1716 RepID=X5DIM0_9CORY|nr:Hypothetical protein CGLY_02275 [Corynebacterium glyciniphilum AJ 3170]